MSFRQFINELDGNRIEGELVKSILYSFIFSFGLLLLLYFFRLKYIDGFISKYGFFLFFEVLSFSVILPSVRHVRAYRQFSCMSGMMIGMTTGMIAGFLPGYFMGATNGMFYGVMFGMLVGIPLGIWNGKCCGIMGIMEGLMAGFMGGLMGAMTSVMLLNDNLKIASVIIFLISVAIMFSLNYMIYFEMKENEVQYKEDNTIIIFLSLVLTAITVWLMVFGPRSFLFS